MSEKTTKTSRSRKPRYKLADLAREYRFNYSRSKPNRFAPHFAKDAVVVVLDPDVAPHFRDPKQVNSLLRATIKALKGTRSRRSDR